MAVKYPVIGHWFRRPSGMLFEVVAIDEQDSTIEIQQFDGTIDEVDLEAWPELLLVEVRAPEDEIPTGFHDPLAFLDKL